jgi:GDP-L-fucose synthase
VIPALIKKIVDAKQSNAPEVVVWGTGAASREFLYVDDAAEGIILATEKYNKPEPVNLGIGQEISIKNLVILITNIVGYTGKIIWDKTKPDGQPRRCLDVTVAKKEFDFIAKTTFDLGLKQTIEWYIQNLSNKSK